MNLYERLTAYSNSDYYGFHMPGHKRSREAVECRLPYELDITEIEGFDDLHHAKGILKEAQMRAAKLYGADKTFFLINGSTSGILSAIMGSTSRGDTILVARNCHKSVYHAICMNELKPVYLYPEFLPEIELNGQILVSDVKQLLKEHSDIRAVVITSPTYDGVVSDVAGIADAVHESGIPLIVDEAHGAHLGFHTYFPENSNRLGADVVIHSLHKTLPALTQSALLHINGGIADSRNIERYMHMLQTSSPSYILMASMDACLEQLEERGSEYFDSYVELLVYTRIRLRKLEHLRLVETASYDKSKIIISVNAAELPGMARTSAGISSTELYDVLLRQYHLQMEMKAGSYVLAMTSAADTEAGINRLIKALEEIDAGLAEQTMTEKRYVALPRLKRKYTSAQVEAIRKNRCKSGTEYCAAASKQWKECTGYMSAEYAYIYPPGIPLIVPGEVISKEVIELLEKYSIWGFSIEGLQKEGEIEVLING